MSTEVWLPIPGWDGYYDVSNHGRIRSHSRTVSAGRNKTRVQRGQIMTPSPNGLGRYQAALSREGRSRLYQVHRLVLLAFVGPCPPGMEGLHWDDDPTNNHLSNLRYGTRSANRHDRVRNGRDHYARRTHCKHGHELTAENIYRNPNDNGRQCKACTTRRDRERKAARRAARLGMTA